MQASLAFFLGLLTRPDRAAVTAEDFASEHGPFLRLCQRLGFLATEPSWNPCAGCPHCQDGEPYLLGNRFLCGTCQSTVDRSYLLLWLVDLGAFLSWLAQGLKLKGDMRPIDEQLWQLGSLQDRETLTECFFCRSGTPGEQGRKRLLAYRSAILLCPLPTAERIDGFQGQQLSLLELLRLQGHALKFGNPLQLIAGGRGVRFDESNGTLWAGTTCLGDVAVNSKEHALLTLLWRRLDEYVPYSDLKQFVLHQVGSTDSTEEATFCQRLKNRIKKTVPRIDDLVATTNKGDGYRFRQSVQATASQLVLPSQPAHITAAARGHETNKKSGTERTGPPSYRPKAARS